MPNFVSLKMIITHVIKCHLPKHMADTLNRESARIYNNVLVNHWRIRRKKGIWLSQHAAEKLEDAVGGATILHAHSRDAAQQSFYKACKTIKKLKKVKRGRIRFPYKLKSFRTTIWKNTSIRLKDDYLLLSRARGLDPIKVNLPSNVRGYSGSQFKEVRLAWQRTALKYEWHIVVDDKRVIVSTAGDRIAAFELKSLDCYVMATQTKGVIFQIEGIRYLEDYFSKRVEEIIGLQCNLIKGSRRWQGLENRKTNLMAHYQRRMKDIEHKLSRIFVDWSLKYEIRKIIVTDIRNVPSSNLYSYFKYKAIQAGFTVEWIDSRNVVGYCPQCGLEIKNTQDSEQSFLRECLGCYYRRGIEVDTVSNILSLTLFRELGHVLVPEFDKLLLTL